MEVRLKRCRKIKKVWRNPKKIGRIELQQMDINYINNALQRYPDVVNDAIDLWVRLKMRRNEFGDMNSPYNAYKLMQQYSHHRWEIVQRMIRAYGLDRYPAYYAKAYYKILDEIDGILESKVFAPPLFTDEKKD